MLGEQRWCHGQQFHSVEMLVQSCIFWQCTREDAVLDAAGNTERFLAVVCSLWPSFHSSGFAAVLALETVLSQASTIACVGCRGSSLHPDRRGIVANALYSFLVFSFICAPLKKLCPSSCSVYSFPFLLERFCCHTHTANASPCQAFYFCTIFDLFVSRQ